MLDRDDTVVEYTSYIRMLKLAERLALQTHESNIYKNKPNYITKNNI